MLLYATIQTADWQQMLQFLPHFFFTFWPWKIYSLSLRDKTTRKTVANSE